jgi:hypothetical protein
VPYSIVIATALSAHLEYDLAEVVAAFEMALRGSRFCQGKTPIDDHLKFFFLHEVEGSAQPDSTAGEYRRG